MEELFVEFMEKVPGNDRFAKAIADMLALEDGIPKDSEGDSVITLEVMEALYRKIALH